VKTIDVLDLPEDARELVRECEVKGARTEFQRNGRPVAMLVSYDEYLALRETIDIANDAELAALLNAAEEEVERGELVARGERVRLPQSVDHGVRAMAAHEQELIDASLGAIDDDPIAGAPLFEPLKGLWCYRREHLRIVYRIVAEARAILVLAVVRVALT
jgi:PHD/YefM family antitoxin component YafN of YafNO toxin-antitoxin module/mRNA-degrading endonuclease RelE of RelBE toxin-antitoxin system